MILASHLASGIIPALAIISRFFVFWGRAGRSNTSLRMLSFYFAVTKKTCCPRAMCKVIDTREIMLFIEKPIERSIMISND
jgi:hypothetical protein